MWHYILKNSGHCQLIMIVLHTPPGEESRFRARYNSQLLGLGAGGFADMQARARRPRRKLAVTRHWPAIIRRMEFQLRSM